VTERTFFYGLPTFVRSSPVCCPAAPGFRTFDCIKQVFALYGLTDKEIKLVQES
jgi:hypothetical protein